MPQGRGTLTDIALASASGQSDARSPHHPNAGSATNTLKCVISKLLAVVLPLGLDTFAVAAALGVGSVARSRRRALTMLFTAFEAGMPLVGLALGAPLGQLIGNAAQYLAVGILIAIGLRALFASESEERVGQLSGPLGLGSLALGLSVSLDELAIGFTLGLLRLPAVLVILLIAIQAVIATQLGLSLGDRIGERLRERAEQLAGPPLILLGVVLLLERLLA